MTPMRGIGLKLAAVLILVVMSALIKAASAEVPPGQAVFFRSFFALPVIVIWLVTHEGLRKGLRTENPWGHVWRGVIGTTAMALIFTGLGLLPLSEVQAIQYAAPLLVVILAAVFLGERVRFVRMSAVALGLAGVLAVLEPRLTVIGSGGAELRETLGAIAVLGAAFFSALAQIFVRRMVRTETVTAIVFWFFVSASAMSLLTAPFGWVVPSFAAAGYLVLAGLLGGVGQVFLTSSYRHADVSVLAPFDYASMLFALAIGYTWFGEVPTLQMLGGAVLIVGGGVLIIWREHRLGLKRGKARPGLSPPG